MQHSQAHQIRLLVRCSGSLLLLCLCILAAGSEQATIVSLDRAVDAAYQPGATTKHYRQPDMADLLAWEQFFSHLLGKAMVPGNRLFAEQRDRAAELGYTLDTLAIDEGEIWILREQSILGGGLYLIRSGNASPLFIQAPHVRNDKLSERCAVRAFVASQARAAAFSTISRTTVKPDAGKRYGPADMSHQERSLFSSSTRAAARTLPNMVFLQFHGYGSEARNLGPRTIILSNGTRNPDELQLSLARDLKERWKPLELLIYPDDISVLGGLLNAQGGILLRYPQHHFLHMEMSLPLRQELLAGDPDLFDLRTSLAVEAISPSK